MIAHAPNIRRRSTLNHAQKLYTHTWRLRGQASATGPEGIGKRLVCCIPWPGLEFGYGCGSGCVGLNAHTLEPQPHTSMVQTTQSVHIPRNLGSVQHESNLEAHLLAEQRGVNDGQMELALWVRPPRGEPLACSVHCRQSRHRRRHRWSRQSERRHSC